jgi:DNA-binding NarL/FixJ family response regulator
MEGLSGDRRLKVLVIDDHDLFRTGLRALLEEHGFDVADAAGVSAALRSVRAFAPDVVVMDLNMPDICGIEATPLLLEAAPGTAVLVLTVSTDDERVMDAVRAGASGYLLKDAPLEEIADAITAVAGGQGAIAPSVAPVLLRSVRDAAPKEPPAPVPFTLSRREREVLALLSTGMENQDIARELFVSTSTVKHHVSQVLDKLGAVNRVQAATYAVLAGKHDR